MQNRWSVLAVLFLARVAMGFQFQLVAALSPLYGEAFGVGLADVGLLISLYLLPGLVFAFPGGAIGARFGDKRVVAAGLVLMAAGGLLMAVSDVWSGQMAGRLLAGIGGVLLNVLMSKMVGDVFTGREIGTAMGIFVNSWPIGIALALIVLPPISAAWGLDGASWSVVVATASALALFVLGYRTPPAADTVMTTAVTPLRGAALLGILLAGSIWGLYNIALAMVFGFGTAFLSETGWSLAAAASVTSLTLWLAAISVPAGGVVADWTGRRDLVIVLGSLVFAGALVAAALGAPALLVFALAGLIGGLPAGPIMSLPSLVLSAGNRAVGMGLFYTAYYVMIVIGPILAGVLSDAAGSAAAALYLGAAMLLVVVAILAALRVVARRVVLA